VSAHTHPSPVATQKGDTGKPIRATIAPLSSEGVDGVPVELAGVDAALVEVGGSDDVVVEQPDAATATPTAIAAATRNQIRART
jgi:hypothetical protein